MRCSSISEKNESAEQKDSTLVSRTELATTELAERTLRPADTEEKRSIKSLAGTAWIRHPFEESPNCVDTLSFMNDSTGYEYRCEFESINIIDYVYSNDTLEIHEYGNISEVYNRGREIKYRWRYIRTNDKLKLIGYIKGVEKPIAPTSNNVTYEFLIVDE
jgi:hypothetical protein